MIDKSDNRWRRGLGSISSAFDEEREEKKKIQ